MKTSGDPVKRIPVTLRLDDGERPDIDERTDRAGIALFPNISGSGRVFIDGRAHYQGKLDGEILVQLWSLTGGASGVESGAPSGIDGGSIAYPSMQTDSVMVEGRMVTTDSEGYIAHPGEWSEAFARSLEEKEGLELTSEHREVIHYLRAFYNDKHIQCTVRDMIKHFRKTWGKNRGSNKYLHEIFPRGGPQKQGNRLAGLLRTKGEH
ncbi:MAG: TusE/DsrC/DsvC family sulfur relay protein [Pseudomonadota bacterium]|nr:TusE/DsrC/DsvC family sulfur relay protein [Pseudomonadota bacterium]